MADRQSYNHVVLVGRIATEKLQLKSSKGKKFCRFYVATNQLYRNIQDPTNPHKKAEFIPVIAWGQTAEFVSKFFRKGSLVTIPGVLRATRYTVSETDDEGKKRTLVEVHADQVIALGKREEFEETIEGEKNEEKDPF